jgi:hypothetical protein
LPSVCDGNSLKFTQQPGTPPADLLAVVSDGGMVKVNLGLYRGFDGGMSLPQGDLLIGHPSSEKYG